MLKISLLFFITIIHQSVSTLYSLLPNYTVIESRSYDQLVYATYQNKLKETGWNYLKIYANGQKGLLDQHKGAGFIEGYVTYRDIYSAYNNLQGSTLKGDLVKLELQNFVDQQLQYLQKMIENHPMDIYWQFAEAYLTQLKYMYRGYLTRLNIMKTQYMYISFSEFYYLTNNGDMEDLIPAFKGNLNDDQKVQLGNCNGYVKLLDGELYIGHSTHNIYQLMLRIFKTYHFPSRNQNVGSQWFSFSSRPGDLSSKDDFYVLSSGLTVFETSFQNLDQNNYKELSPKTVPAWLRKCITSNLAKSGSKWIDYFLKERSGTHNNQWVIVDSNKLKQQKQIVMFLEEAFSIYEVFDMTKDLKEKGYIASYNVPKNKNIYDKLNYQECNYHFIIDPFTYDRNPRADEYARYNKLINNEEDMKKWLLNNDNQDQKVGIAPRYDLAKNNPRPFGLVDLKIVSQRTLNNNFIWAYSGPSKSNGRFPAFDWTNWPNTTHEGMPMKWDFTWQKYVIVDGSNEGLEMELLEM